MLTIAFIYLEITVGASERLETIYYMIMAFYFGTQMQKNQTKIDAPKENGGE
jgi:hypothetical protein